MTPRRRRKGQSTVEFALMMPIIMGFFFWIFETNIYWIGLHQGAYAAYAASRTHLVSGGPTAQDPKDTMNDILTGRIWKGAAGGGSRGGSPELRRTRLVTRGLGGMDGVTIELPSLASLPYVSTGDNPLLHFNTEVSTHLGWSEYDQIRYPNPRERECAQPFGCQMVTDNNLRDY